MPSRARGRAELSASANRALRARLCASGIERQGNAAVPFSVDGAALAPYKSEVYESHTIHVLLVNRDADFESNGSRRSVRAATFTSGRSKCDEKH